MGIQLVAEAAAGEGEYLTLPHFLLSVTAAKDNPPPPVWQKLDSAGGGASIHPQHWPLVPRIGEDGGMIRNLNGK